MTKESVHHLYKLVAGVPLQRPPWFFDVKQEGEGIVDVTTHLVDLVQWELFPEQVIADGDVKVLSAKTWKTAVSPEQFTRATAVATFPGYLQMYKEASGNLQLPCNGAFTYTLRGIHAKVSVTWNFEAPAGAGGSEHAAEVPYDHGSLQDEPVGHDYTRVVFSCGGGLPQNVPSENLRAFLAEACVVS